MRRFLLFLSLVLLAACRTTGWVSPHHAKDTDEAGSGEAHAVKDGRADEQADAFHVNTVQEIDHLPQGWTDEERTRFYYWSQGSRIMPYSFFVALREAGTEAKFARDEVFMRLRYLPEKPDPKHNPDGLPVGFTKDGEHDFIGFSCATCHTGQVNFEGKGYRIDGGGTGADFEGFVNLLHDSMQETWDDPMRFSQFAQDVLGKKYSEPAEAELRPRFEAALTNVRAYRDATETAVKGGFARVDALGGGLNVALAAGLGIPENRVLLKGPVSYPPIWDAGYYDYVEWNGFNHNAGFGPLGRNVGEALGVFAELHLDADTKSHVHKSSIRVDALVHIETLSRKLESPLWPDTFPPIDAELAARGEAIYNERCHRCHMRMPRHDPKRAPRSVMVPLDEIGTDPTMALEFANRRAKTGMLEGRKVGLGDEVFGPEASGVDLLTHLVIGTVLSNPGAAIEEQLLAFAEHRGTYADEPGRLGTESIRAYRARALNGIWSTAPYLHNGSVPTIYELLLPPDQRVKSFTTGRYEFDAKEVGIVQDPFEGGFTFDATIEGNLNGGHTYGTDLSDDDRWALVEYIKGL